MGASVVGSHLFNRAQTRQRERTGSYMKAVTRSEEKFRKIFETSASVVAIFTVPESVIVDVNPAWEKTFGICRAEAIGQSPVELGLVQDATAYLQFFASLKRGDAGELQDPVIYRVRCKDPIYCVYSWSTLELDDALCVLVVGQDITVRIRAEEELRRNREAMANQDRLTAVGELASGVAHDLNNSLSALRLNLELLRAERIIPADYHKRLDLLTRIVTDAHSTIGRLQDFARRRHDRPMRAVDLSTIIHQSLEMARGTLEEKNALLAIGARELLAAIADLREQAQAAGRNPDSVSVTSFGAKPDEFKMLEDAGVERAVFWLPSASANVVLPELDRLASLLKV
jgi:PAS domain S-box-containing protein